jgi:hypothetical protein
LVSPTFVKHLVHPVLCNIWQRAFDALNMAGSVHIWGYSLPDADGAARALFLALRHRVSQGTVDVTVHDPGAPTRARWARLQCVCSR